jgi:hypothetical protein
MTPSVRLLGSLSLLVATVLLACGCGQNLQKARAVVKGSISIGDKKLNAGNITFATADGRTGTGSIDESGNYIVTDAPIGECTIVVSVPAPKGGSMQAPGMKPPAGIPGMEKMAGPKMVDPSKVVQIPQKYNSRDTSDLKYTVRSGEQTHDIKLNP